MTNGNEGFYAPDNFCEDSPEQLRFKQVFYGEKCMFWRLFKIDVINFV